MSFPALVTLLLVLIEASVGAVMILEQDRILKERKISEVSAVFQATTLLIDHEMLEFSESQADVEGVPLHRHLLESLLTPNVYGAFFKGDGDARTGKDWIFVGNSLAETALTACRQAPWSMMTESGAIRTGLIDGQACAVSKINSSEYNLLMTIDTGGDVHPLQGSIIALLTTLLVTAGAGAALSFRQAEDVRRLKREQAEIIRRESLELKNRLLMHLSHELRTPLGQSIGYCDLLSHEPFGPLGAPQYRDWLRAIIDANERLRRLIDNALDFCRIRSQQDLAPLSPLDVRFEVESVRLMILRLMAPAPVQLVNLVDVAPQRAWGDQALLLRILTVLIDNAVAASPVDGTVTLSSCDLGDVVELYVDDEGPGAPIEIIEGLGAPFATSADLTTRTRDGVGLGLAVAYHAALAMQAHLRLSLRPSGGARAILRLTTQPSPPHDAP